ncbi:MULTISPECIES: hypothetical protein [Acidithrix]|uniref:Uncharacterized protein n=1 Tax=Acidithrix ferrooxidans TaxID=1280514 RepID=A0A0D8HKA7_9ACTN|nr:MULTISPECIES: hypothetical protein [Acidithrix]KJF18197.1 hypothetical protein AXFE_09430 [Acidithrix ferrooxidans]
MTEKVTLEITLRRVAENLWLASLLDDPDLSSLATDPVSAQWELRSVVALSMGLEPLCIEFRRNYTTKPVNDGPTFSATRVDILRLEDSSTADYDSIAAALRRSHSDALKLAREALRKLVIEDSLTLAEAAAAVGITPIQAAALVEN